VIIAALGVEAILPGRWWPALPRVVTGTAAIAAVALAVAPVSIHRFRATELKELRPIIDRILPDPSAPLAGFHTNVHLRASSLVYLDRDVDSVELPDLGRVPAGVVVTERQFGDRLERAGLTPLHVNRRYALFTRAQAAVTARAPDEPR
jgi:hypothetical protein